MAITQQDTQKLAIKTGKILFEPTEILDLQSHVDDDDDDDDAHAILLRARESCSGTRRTSSTGKTQGFKTIPFDPA